MKNIKILPSCISGTLKVPSSKSLAHRALICSALAFGTSNIYDINMSNDINATKNALIQMGANIQNQDGNLKINKSIWKKDADNYINCYESASTLRFLIPVVAALGLTAIFTGEGRLSKRPIGMYKDLLFQNTNGVNINFPTDDSYLPMKMSGKLQSGKFYVQGNVSSQFITGLLLALPIIDGDSEIILTSLLESEPYVDMTIEVQKIFGVTIQKSLTGYHISGNQQYKATSYVVEGDFSQAAFFACAAAINGDVSIKGLSPFSCQGDFKIVELLTSFGAKAVFDGNILNVKKSENLKAIDIDAKNIPDLIPILSVVAAYAEGKTKIYNAQRLRLKESDRLSAIYELLKAIGSDVVENENGLEIIGKPTLKGGSICAYGDHRIAMAASIAALKCEHGIIIDDMSCINKSYPTFLETFNTLIKL